MQPQLRIALHQLGQHRRHRGKVAVVRPAAAEVADHHRRLFARPFAGFALCRLLRQPLPPQRVRPLGRRHHLGAAGVALHVRRLAALDRRLGQVLGRRQHAVAVRKRLHLAGEIGAEALRLVGRQRIQVRDAVKHLGRKDQVVRLKHDRHPAPTRDVDHVGDQGRPRHAVQNDQIAHRRLDIKPRVVRLVQGAVDAPQCKLLLVMAAAIAPRIAANAADK